MVLDVFYGVYRVLYKGFTWFYKVCSGFIRFYKVL